MMDIIEETNWVVVGIIYILLLIAIWKMTFLETSEGANEILFKMKAGISIIMLPIVIVIVRLMGD